MVSRFVSDIALDVLWEKQTSLAPLFQTIPRVTRRVVKWRRYYEGWEFFDSDEPDSEIVQRTVLKIPCSHQLGGDEGPELENAIDDGPGDGVRDDNACVEEDSAEEESVEDETDSGSDSDVSEDDCCLEDDCDPDDLEFTDAEYERFMHYARRIRSFDAQLRNGWFSRKIFIDNALLFAALRRGPILPRVRSIRLHKRKDLFRDGDHVFEVDRPSPDGYGEVIVHDMQATLGQLCPLAHIRDVTLPPDRDLYVLADLRDLPFLETLHLTHCRRISKAASPARAGFRALRSLSISGTSRLDHARTILSRLSSEPLRLRAFSHRNKHDMVSAADCKSAHDLFRELRARLDLEYLEQLTVSTPRCILYEPARSLLKDLCAFPNVRVANIRLAHSPGIDVDEVLDVITSAWPSLEKIFIQNNPNESFRHALLEDPNSETRRHGSLTGLAPLALRCPRLTVVSVPLQIRSESRAIPRPLEPAVANVFATRHIGVDVGQGDVGNRVDEVAAFIASLFPSLRFISACDAGSEVIERWEEVERKVKHKDIL
ncbi:hypothetical protein BD626DRAFT_574917 [Schizophyllum amplum]|uniref:F-box domain-containing protein n=1 Tax=Schizophyllum amplum TaxID=97359 RepID=A0A550BX39_9AGAR|nr:hypothetical protein BD626DRAFT_574917 [Auriculariopsis ampla]